MFRRAALATLVAPLALALTACGEEAVDGEIPEGEPIAAIPAPDGQAWADMASETPEGGFVMGNPEAPVKLVEYASHTCGHCAEFSKAAAAPLRDKYVASGVVSYEIRNQIHDPVDLTFAVLARCAGPQAFHPLAEQGWHNLNGFFETLQGNQGAYEAAMEQQGAELYQGIAQAAGMFEFFAQRGVSRDQAMQCLSDEAKASAIAAASSQQSNDLNVTGTPTFFINGRNIGTQSWATLEPMLQKAGAR
jgi:protein-disulfide isomerase